uniref:PB1-like domain-containing protein n=1 Tax=Nelumbo nucifera TaxID=4432 RepID=A0A822ZUA3_NELNU|nr:TPA_asm: hypothetical protein HUJ06_016393 [Nelumbo nucifera]
MEVGRYMFIVNHCGQWKTINGKLSYVGGDVGYVDNIDSDRICYLDIIDDFCNLCGIPNNTITINYKVPNRELEEQLDLLGSKSDMLRMFSLHGYMCGIIFCVTATDAKCVSVDDMCVKRSGKNSGHGKGKYTVESDGDCCIVKSISDDDAHYDDQNCGDGLGGDDDWLEGDIGDSNLEQDYGKGMEADVGEFNKGKSGVGSGAGVPSIGHDGVGVSSAKDIIDLSDYEPLSDNGNLESGGYGLRMGNPPEFDFYKPKFLVGMEFATINEFREALRHYCVVEGV